MSRNPFNKDRAKVHVLPPTRLEIIQYNMDAAIGDPIDLHVALYGKLGEGQNAKEIPFSDCRDVRFQVYIPDGKFVHNSTTDNPQPIGIACTTIRVIGLEIGKSEITIAYSSNIASSATDKYLIDNITVSAYERLIAVHPSSGETVLAVGTSRNIIFKGGPHPWSGKPQGYSRRITISDEEIIKVTEHKNSDTSPDKSVYEIICKSLGDVLLTYTISNTPLLPNCRSSDATATIRVICGKPRYIKLELEFKDSENCPISRNTERFMARSDEPLRLRVTVSDEDGRRFDNITSLNIEWNIKPNDPHPSIQLTNGLEEQTFTDFNVVLPQSHYLTIAPKKNVASLVINARVTGYQNRYVLSKNKISPEYPPFGTLDEHGDVVTPVIEAQVHVSIVNDTTITPNHLKVLNDPSAKYSLRVSQGSGYYEFVLSTDDIADIRYVEPTKTITVIPKKSGFLKIGLVDLCLASARAEAEIQVQQLAGIEMESVNKVEKGKCIVATVRLYDTNGDAMEIPTLDAVDIDVEIDDGYLEMKKLPVNEQGEPPYSRILYMIHGSEVGEARVALTSGTGDREIRSETTTIQVFTPLKVNERNLTVLVGTICQIGTSGGPSNAEIEFFVENESILTIDRRGILEGKAVGHAKVIARAVGPSVKGTRIVYSQDHVYVQVTHLQGIKIVVPTTRIKVGAVIPLWAFGIPENLTPLIIGSSESPLSFTWLSSDSKLLSLHDMYENTGINIRYQNEVTLRARALKAGLATIYLNVTTPSGSILRGYKDEASFGTFVKVEIFEELTVTNPEITAGIPVLLMTPNSVMKIQTNRDKHGVSSYKILTNGHTSESDDPRAITQTTKTVTIDKMGVVKSGDNFGRTIILVSNVESYNLKQTVTIIVDVKPIHYMMLSLNSNIRIRSGEELNMLPKGMELNYIVEYFDSVGNKFHATNAKFNIAASRTDLVTFAGGSENVIAAKFHEDGELVAKIYNDKYPNGIFDYVHMTIGDIIFPTKVS